MKKWKLSRYTTVFKGNSGDAFLHNSFMGAVAQIPVTKFAEVERVINREIVEEDLKSESLRELCTNGFFFPSHIEEQQFVTDVLDKENKNSVFDLILLPHENCNFRCEYCYETHKRGIMAPNIVEGLKRFVREKVKQSKGLRVSWFGGEPLLAKDVIYELSDSFMESCEANGIPYSSHMTTNAYLLTPEVADNLFKRKVDNFQITFDGPEITHDTTRKLAGGGGTFKTIFNNLIEIQKKDVDFYISLRVNFNDDSIAVMEDFFKLMSDSFGNDPRFGLYFRPIGKYGGANDDNLRVCEPSYGRIAELELTEKYSEFGYLDKIIKRSLQPHGQVCYAGKESSIIIGADGTLYKCSVAFEDPKNHVGKLLEDGSLEIDESLWNLWVDNKDRIHSNCTSCTISPLCQGKYCPRDTIKDKKPVCPMTPLEYGHLVRLVAAGSSGGRIL